MRRCLLMLLVVTAGLVSLAASAAEPSWTLRSGPVECRFQQAGSAVNCSFFGPSGAAAAASAPWGPCLAGRVEGRDLSPENVRVVSTERAKDGAGLLLVLRHQTLPLDIQVRYTAWGQTGVFARQTSLVNRGEKPLRIDAMPSLALLLPEGDCQLTTLQGTWGVERQVVTEKLVTPKTFESPWGRSTSRMSPWFCLHHAKTRRHYLVQLAWSGNWNLHFSRPEVPDAPAERQPLRAEIGPRFDHGGPLTLAPGKTFDLPAAAFTVTAGDRDDAANALHRYQRQYIVPRTPTNEPPLVQFNSWYPFPGKLNVAQMKRCLDVAAELGTEVFVLDAGWYNKHEWFREVGDWRPDPKAFPKGTAELARYAHDKGMKFGIWMEIEGVGDQSQLLAKHPEWCLQSGGRPVRTGVRSQLDFGRPEVRAWARTEMDRIIREHDLDWVKIDYNVDIGEKFEAADGTRPGDMLYRHLVGYYGWLDELRAAWPKLVIENCGSGGLRFDLGILAHTHTTWISDEVGPIPSVQLAYGSTLEFLPEACNHWMVGDGNGEVKPGGSRGWWDFMFRVPMNGQFGISSRVFDWDPALRKCAAENVAIYKRLRSVIVGSDVYHLTPPPAHQNPTGWMALQYVQPDRQRSVVMAYRLGRSEPQQLLKLRGLDVQRKYRVTVDGQTKGELSGAQLAGDGLSLELDAAWRAAVVELQAAP